MGLVADYLTVISSIKDFKLRKQYAEGYSKIVKEAAIPEDSKELVLICTSTAINSYSLWENESEI